MNTIQPYLFRIQDQLIKFSQWEHFFPVTVFIAIAISFLVGRKTYESKFGYILNTINDSQNQKQRLKNLKEKRQKSLKFIRDKMLFFKLATLLVILSVGAYLYMFKTRSQMTILIWSGASIILFWAIIFGRLKYLKVMLERTTKKLDRQHHSSEQDTKEIMNLLGPQICTALKTKFQRQLQTQWQTQSLKECDLLKCHNQKKNLKALTDLYKQIIAQMKETSWCNICIESLNIDANQLKLFQIQKRLKNYENVSQKLGLEKGKELTNRLLEQWQLLESKLPRICKRGCCIKFRVALQQIKNRHHQQLKQLKLNLAK